VSESDSPRLGVPDGGDPDRDRLLLDAMLGKLATYLRMCGYDAAYALDRGVERDDRLREIAGEEGRRLVTRDESLAESVPDAVLLTERNVVGQLRELETAGFDLALAETPTRCGDCNGRLVAVAESESRPEYVPDDRDEVWRCRDCGQCFWKGSHWERVAETLAAV
jgi:uncharacterized protein with PIN domain